MARCPLLRKEKDEHEKKKVDAFREKKRLGCSLPRNQKKV
jgi:hypothetical protein